MAEVPSLVISMSVPADGASVDISGVDIFAGVARTRRNAQLSSILRQ